jgi:hypothetical protein
MLRVPRNSLAEVDFSFEDARNQVITPADVKVDVRDPYGNIWISGGATEKLDSTYRFSFIPGETVTTGLHLAVAYGDWIGKRVFATEIQNIDVFLPEKPNYANLDDLKSYLLELKETDYPLARYLLWAASEHIDHYCRREFATVRDFFEQEQLYLAEEYFLQHYPVQEITELKIITDGATELPSYSLVAKIGRIIFEQPISGRLQVRYKAGYARLPAPVSLACLQLTSIFLFKRQREGISSERLSDYSFVIRDNEIRKVLDQLIDFRRTLI